MNAKLISGTWTMALLTVVLLAGCGKEQEKPAEVESRVEQGQKQLVFVGDTQKRVYEMLGSPSIEFPDGGTMVQWYAGYEILVSNNVVTDVRMKPVESEAEKLEKEQRARLSDMRLHAAYEAVAEKDKISYNAWRAREQQRLQREREDRATVKAYEERKSKEKKAAIYADAIKKSCGCTYRYCRH